MKALVNFIDLAGLPFTYLCSMLVQCVYLLLILVTDKWDRL